MSHAAVCSATRAVAALGEARARALADPRTHVAGADVTRMHAYLLGGPAVREPMAILEERMRVGGYVGGYVAG